MLTKINTLFFIQDGPKHMCWQKLKILILTQKRVFVNFEGTVLPSSLILCHAFDVQNRLFVTHISFWIKIIATRSHFSLLTFIYGIYSVYWHLFMVLKNQHILSRLDSWDIHEFLQICETDWKLQWDMTVLSFGELCWYLFTL